MWPAVLSTKQAHDYCGGRPAFEELLRAFPKLPPFRRTPRGDTYYLRSTIDHHLSLAEMQGCLVHTQPQPS